MDVLRSKELCFLDSYFPNFEDLSENWWNTSLISETGIFITLRPRQNDHHMANSICRCILFKENIDDYVNAGALAMELLQSYAKPSIYVLYFKFHLHLYYVFWCPRKAINTLRPIQNGHHFLDIFICVFLNEKVWISMAISLKFVSHGPMKNMSALVQIMAWRRSGDKPLSEPMMAYFADVYLRHSASMS